MNHIFVHLFHIIVIGSLFLYVAIQKTNIPKNMFLFLFILGIIIICYHIFKAFQYFIKKQNYWVNLIHIFFIGPLLVYIGFNKGNVARMYFELLLMFAFASIGYHGYYLFQTL